MLPQDEFDAEAAFLESIKEPLFVESFGKQTTSDL